MIKVFWYLNVEESNLKIYKVIVFMCYNFDCVMIRNSKYIVFV